MSSEALAKWQIGVYLISGEENLPDVEHDGWQPPAVSVSQIHAAQEMLVGYFGMPWILAENWYVFGPERGNRIDLIFETESNAAIVARLDARNDSTQFLELVCRLARELACQLFLPELNAIIQPDRLPLLMALGDIHKHVSYAFRGQGAGFS